MKIQSNLKNDEIEKAFGEILNQEIESRIRILWGLFKQLEGDREFEELKRKILFEGLQYYKFDLRKIIYGEIEKYHDSNHVKVKGLHKMDIYFYWDELEAREKKMKDLIEEQYDEGLQREEYDEKYDK